jgi:hypothetical protein
MWKGGRSLICPLFVGLIENLVASRKCEYKKISLDPKARGSVKAL